MHLWLKLAGVTVVTVVGIGLVAGSVLGGPGPLPDVGAPVLMEAASDEDPSSDHDERSATEGGIVHPDPLEEARDRRAAAAERSADRQQARAELLAARVERREAREGRGPYRAGPSSVDDDRGRDDRAENSPGGDDGDDGDGSDDRDSGDRGDDRDDDRGDGDRGDGEDDDDGDDDD